MLNKIINTILIIAFSWCLITVHPAEAILFDENELPLSQMNSIIVDKKQNVYVGLDAFEKFKVYVKNVKFVANLDMNAFVGSVCLALSGDTNIIVYAKRTDIMSVYNTDGYLITSENVRKIPYEIVMNQYRFEDGNSDIYEITDDFFPIITKNGEVFISQQFYYKAFYQPQTLYLALLCLLLFVVNNVKWIIKFVRKYTS